MKASLLTLGILLLAATAAICAGPSAYADSPAASLPFVSPLFSDNMVLQRGRSVPVWGWTTPGAQVTVTIAGKSAEADADQDGKWTATLSSLPVGGPYTLTIAGPQTVTLTNVLVGDVWICSGQSNMQFGVGNLVDPKAETADANYPQIRLFTVPSVVGYSPVTSLDSSEHWEVCTQDNLLQDGSWGGFSAVAYFFGRDLYQNLHVPIGLIHTSWGGTPAEAWTSEAALTKSLPEMAPGIEQVTALRTPNPLTYDQQVAQWYTANDPGSAGNAWAAADFDDSKWPTMSLPHNWGTAGIPELAGPYQGVVWFRKELDLPADYVSKDYVLHLLVDDADTTWVNGTQIGTTASWDAQRAYKIPQGVLKAGKNIIAVRVLNTGNDGGIYGDANGLYLSSDGSSNITLAVPWRYGIGASLSKSPNMPSQQGNPNLPTVLYNGMINPLLPYGIKGAIWYQGESNADRAFQYRTLLPTMISDWRSQWGEGNFPFLIVQLAGFEGPPAQPGDDAWAELREAQWLTTKKLPNTGIATAIDIGNAGDIHPKNKEEVGKRLALVAEKIAYSQKVDDSGPVYKSMKVDGSDVRISFDHADGLVTHGDGPISGFAIAGADQKWYWADAKIDGKSIVVSSPQVPTPVAVRYAWASFLPLNLYNGAGLPAFPFRTDDWRPSTEPASK